jgi:L-ascorbate metabolism protein UlaG (beta-lactamase superfamily)
MHPVIMPDPVRFTLIGGSTALIEFSGVRFLTDPTFDPAGSEFRSGSYVLERISSPCGSSESVLPVDAVLLSHDHHFDNLDASGRQFLNRADRVLTTKAGAERLGGNAIGLAPWESYAIAAPAVARVTVTATPARHGPADGDRGPVIGFVLADSAAGENTTYVSGDTVWYEGIAEVAARFRIHYAVLFMGAARVEAVGPHHLTFTADEAVQVAKALPGARIIPLHFEGWRHFSEGRELIDRAFRGAGLRDRLFWGEPGVRLDLPRA